MRFRALEVMFLGWLLTACANYSPVATDSLRAPSNARTLVFDNDFLFTNSKPGAVQRYCGLLAGPYRATFEDDRGTYYISTTASVVWASDPETNRQFLAQGGVWISKRAEQPRFKIFRVMGTEVTRSTVTGAVTPFQFGIQADTTAAIAQLASNQAINGPRTISGAAGTALGTAIGLTAAIELAKLDVGKLKFDRDDPPPQLSIEGRYLVEQ